MAEDKNKIVAQRIETAIGLLEDKKSSIYFFVTDCKNVPNSEMLYIYQMALTLKELGYDVCMVYQLNNEYSKHELKKLKKANKPIDKFRVSESGLARNTRNLTTLTSPIQLGEYLRQTFYSFQRHFQV